MKIDDKLLYMWVFGLITGILAGAYASYFEPMQTVRALMKFTAITDLMLIFYVFLIKKQK